MNTRPDNLSAGFFLGFGCLKLTRGLGPCSGVPIVESAVAHAKDGGPGPHARATVPDHPQVLGVDVSGRSAKKCSDE
jgi:hypothetical protein